MVRLDHNQIVNTGAGADVIRIGLDVPLAGMGLQQLFIAIFLVLMITFHRRAVSKTPDSDSQDETPSSCAPKAFSTAQTNFGTVAEFGNCSTWHVSAMSLLVTEHEHWPVLNRQHISIPIEGSD
ncbi:Uu.00g056910.m01.CDS01 [Anthostomella pinea]|uniref:Uu.00g056910.m01.CDS01 n=1 Tax=Anthostomella pinea TaxID=933095 RepID=A0AAI8VRI2_9PEZI|nr:Uu.00g056910.m01.CDS01 [Anthostomella pinea]